MKSGGTDRFLALGFDAFDFWEPEKVFVTRGRTYRAMRQLLDSRPAGRPQWG
jgi:hypothetical protein